MILSVSTYTCAHARWPTVARSAAAVVDCKILRREMVMRCLQGIGMGRHSKTSGIDPAGYK